MDENIVFNAGHKTLTELGVEKKCISCKEYWPSDGEFFAVMATSRDGLSPRCRACIKEKAWGVRIGPAQARAGEG